MKQTSEIRLSICIPTLNRGAFIGQTLESIVSQATELEIVIVDGGSTDNTQEVVRDFQHRFGFIRYFRPDDKSATEQPVAPSGAGFDQDCNRAVELARGDYCWLFTDDDILKAGAVQAVLNATKNDYELIIANAEVRSCDLLTILQPTRLRLTADRAYKPGEWEQLFTDVCDHLSFVGGVVIKRELWVSRSKTQYWGSGFIHVGVILQAPIPGDAFAIIEPLITIRYGNALYMRTSRFFEIWAFVWPNLIWSFPYFSDSAKSQVIAREPWRRKRTLLMFRAKGAFSKREYTQWLESRFDSWWDKFASGLVARLPGRAANLIFVIHHYLLRRRCRVDLDDFVNSPFYFARRRRTASSLPGTEA